MRPQARHEHREPPRPPAAPPAPVEHQYEISVKLTAREIAALVGEPHLDERPVAFCVTSADTASHRVNRAEAALRKFRDAVQQQRGRS